MNVFELFAKLGLDSSEYDKGLDESEKKGSNFGKNLGKVVGSGAKVAGAAIAATTAVTVAGAKAFISGAANVSAYGNEIDKNSQKMNMSAKGYQEWAFILEHTGASIEGMKTSMKKLVTAAEEGSDAFMTLGISQEDLAKMSPEETWNATIKALQNVEDAGQRTALATKLLGKGAVELAPLFNTSAEATEQMRKQVNDLGGVMSDDAIKASAGFQDSLQNVNVSLSGMKNNMLSSFLPAFSTTMDGLANIFSGVDTDKGLSQIEQGIKGLADGLVNKAPQLFAIGGSILKALANSITGNLPILLNSAVPIVMELVTGVIKNLPTVVTAAISLVGAIVDGISKNLPMILNAAKDVILALANAIAQNAPTIIPTIISLIMTIVTTLTNPEFLVPLIQAGIQIVLGLINGIVNAIPLIIEQIPVIIENIVNVLLEGLPLILDAGIQIFNALIEALPVILESLSTALPKVIDTIVKLIVKGLPLLLKGAVQLFMAIIQALPTIITALVKNIPTIVTTIISTLLNNLPMLIQGAIQLFMGIIQAIPRIVVELGRQMPSIISAIVNGLKSGVSQIASVGSNLIKGLWNGISNMAGWIKSKIQGFGKNVLNNLKNFFGIHSPSTVFRDQIGKFLALGIGEGFSDEVNDVAKDMAKSANGIADDINDALALDDIGLNVGLSASGAYVSASKKASASGSSVTFGNMTFNLYASEGQDIRELAKEVATEIQNLIDDKEKAYA